MNWSKIAEKALNIYYESFVENRDHCIAQKIANKFIKLLAIKAGFEFKNLSSNTVPRKELIIFFNQFAERMRYFEKEKKLETMENFCGHCTRGYQITVMRIYKFMEKMDLK